ncbi:MAG TPA: MurT ligase domain-containing protein [Acidimicrobiales bacterium]
MVVPGPPDPSGTPPSVRTRLAIAAGRLTGWVSRVTGRGEGGVIGGKLALLVDPDLIATIGEARTTLVVSGTNGKTTTTHLLATALGASSSTGANLRSGLASALIARLDSATMVLEVDEMVLGEALSTSPRVAVLLNLSRDQLDRVGEPNIIMKRWQRVLQEAPPGLVVANADDPQIVLAVGGLPTTWVSPGGMWREDSHTCPACGGLLVHDGRAWECSTCDLTRPVPDVVVDGTVVTGPWGSLGLSLALPGAYNIGNAAFALTAAWSLGADPAASAEAMAQVTDVLGRYVQRRRPGGTARLLLAKNPAGWAELLELLADGRDPLVIVINSRIADGQDVSWLWDVPFERLQGRTVVASGDRCGAMSVRLHYAGIAHSVEPDPEVALACLPPGQVDVAATYTAFSDLRRAGADG